jgi:hypothetical protein
MLVLRFETKEARLKTWHEGFTILLHIGVITRKIRCVPLKPQTPYLTPQTSNLKPHT